MNMRNETEVSPDLSTVNASLPNPKISRLLDSLINTTKKGRMKTLKDFNFLLDNFMLSPSQREEAVRRFNRNI